MARLFSAVLVLSSLGFTACRKSEPAAPPAPTCDSVAGQQTKDGVASAHARGLRDACINDSWPPPVVACFARATGDSDERACALKLDEARQDWLRYRVGVAEGREPGWACTELDALLREASSCVRVPSDRDPLPEMKVALVDVRAKLATKDADAQRTSELRCISFQRLVIRHVREAPCLNDH